ncbi:hypothetical protein CPB84DRAFT_1966904 [Gymnopilus junonius]|uniref:F-box domain-containing protein n=1 Tax=Gymnopilus junonius TaxID=109634 RepID=A0A9P5N8J2_GYMJU|nr:hypothetical protein CPB84DRAFT_1966904 [Gymnopilus junonius]
MSRRQVNLDADVLLLIFEMNTNIFTDRRALTTTRLSSQVCRTWRSTILDSTVLWGRLIDMDSLDRGGEEWRHEVLRRSGHSPLFVKGAKSLQWPEYHILCSHCKVSLCSRRGVSPSQRFFLSLVQNNWSRIERLSVSIGSHIADMFEPWPWQIMCSRPAPRLRVFEFHSTSIASFSHFNTKRIFGDYAPLLREFHAPYIPVKYSSAWSHNLRSVQIGPAKASSYGQLLLSLSSMTDLHIEEGSEMVFRELCHMQETTMDIMFPALEAIHMKSSSKELLDFLHMRRNLGLSLPVLNLAEVDEKASTVSLKTFAGFQVHHSRQQDDVRRNGMSQGYINLLFLYAFIVLMTPFAIPVFFPRTKDNALTLIAISNVCFSLLSFAIKFPGLLLQTGFIYHVAVTSFGAIIEKSRFTTALRASRRLHHPLYFLKLRSCFGQASGISTQRNGLHRNPSPLPDAIFHDDVVLCDSDLDFLC